MSKANIIKLSLVIITLIYLTIICFLSKKSTAPKSSKKYIRIEKSDLVTIEKKIEFGNLAEGLFHDLINPISSLSMHIEKLSSQKTDAAHIKRHIENVEHITTKMNDFIRSIKIIIDDTKYCQKNRSYEISESILLMKKLYSYRLRNQCIDLRTRLKSDTTLPIHCIRLNQLFMNHISNSIESFENTDSKRKRYIYICVRKKCKNILRIEIHDNGKGMTEKEQKNAFVMPFSTKNTGSGIGLMTIGHIVKKELDGQIEIRSILGKGTKIYITFPTNSATFFPLKTPTEHHV